MIRTYFLSVAAGKRLIAKAAVALPEVQEALSKHTIVVAAGTTNAYIAEEFLTLLGDTTPFVRRDFFRGATAVDAIPGKASGPVCDLVIKKGKRVLEKTVDDIVPRLEKGDVIFKGANAVNLEACEAGVLIGNPLLGTSLPIIQAAFGRKIRLIVPVGLEKRVDVPISDLANLLSQPEAEGLGLLPLPGEILTELDAVEILTGAVAELVAAGGICGAEGGYWLTLEGDDSEIEEAEKLFSEVKKEPTAFL